jgi:hypothetical protein
MLMFSQESQNQLRFKLATMIFVVIQIDIKMIVIKISDMLEVFFNSFIKS